MSQLKFPDGFLWGAATASHQVEGNTQNNWSEWEKKNAERLAQESEKSFWWNPHWKKFRTEAIDPENYISRLACDHYRRFREDFDLAKELGHTAHRFSIEWSRIEPEEGVFDEKAIDHYREVITALRERNIEPFVTLWHWTLPLWLAEAGGVLSPKFSEHFVRYAEKIVSSLGKEVHFWVTLNEPDVFSGHAYLKGTWPPQEKNLWKYIRSLNALVCTHKKTYLAIKKLSPQSKIGIAKHNIWFEAYQDRLINRLLKKGIDWWWNQRFLNQIEGHQDFIGLNHYNHHRIDNGFRKNENKIQTDFGWEFYPESLYHAAIELKKYKKPIYITENGIADANDHLRPRFIRESLSWLHQAIQDGADVRGYLYWSLLDNFEWDKGYWLRFGLIEVNRKTLERKIRPSARMYAEICRTNTLEIN
ncbi:MAG: glycoside hydrolase family 1 protein [Candidatus Moraniibacteriota bacterium]